MMRHAYIKFERYVYRQRGLWHSFIFSYDAKGITTVCILPLDHSILLPSIQTSLSEKPETIKS